ncbi:hypothetical protein MW290_25565 [Aquincola tertiaricarbonis]|uniref:Uncharacterized protein n=1 Tax=Aquincola tertiaricarbonis TaxID=391953 RepID=A0ABY4S9R8_AQUTE|nr:hypothetical protein [Aquincola tertiaricarbonis]URI08940.1 hypothetical protein MW290_25565 [Aquincola tertiaricarbonis]
MPRCVECRFALAREPMAASDAQRARLLKAMARAGAVNCEKSPYRASFFPALVPRECPDFAPAPQTHTEARLRYFNVHR